MLICAALRTEQANYRLRKELHTYYRITNKNRACLSTMSKLCFYVDICIFGFFSIYRTIKNGQSKDCPFQQFRRIPIFPSRHQLSIFGVCELNFCVRNGNRWILTAISTGYQSKYPENRTKQKRRMKEERTILNKGQALDRLVSAG